MHVGLVTPAWPGLRESNGITTAVSHLATGLTGQGHDVTIIPLRIDAGYEDPNVVPLTDAPRPTLIDRVRRRLGDESPAHAGLAAQIAVATRRAIADHGIDILIMEETQGWASEVQRQISIPVVLTLHGPGFLLRSSETYEMSAADHRREAREGQAFHACAGVSAPSSHVLKMACAHYGPPSGQTAVIANAIPLSPAIDHTALDLTARRNLLYVGRIDRLKGVDILLDGFRQIADEGTDATLTIVGPDKGILQPDGSLLAIGDALAALPEAVRSRIDYRGSVAKTELEALRRQHAIALMTSRFENLNYTLLESMALGMATISTAVGGPAEVLRDGETALLVPPEDAGALARAMQALINDPALAARLGRAAHRDIEKAYQPDLIATQTVTFLCDVLDHWYKIRGAGGL